MCSGVIPYLLPLLSAFALYAIFIFAHNNGLIDALKETIAAGTLPETDERLNLSMTGVKPVDILLGQFIPFFYAVVDGSSTSTMLHGAGFAGALGGVWALVMVEAFRQGNKSRLVAVPALFGMLAQLGTIGLIMPIYAAVHLLTSPTRSNPSQAAITIPAKSVTAIKLIPFSIIAGYFVPSMLMVLPETTYGFLDTKQERIAFWQSWPVYVAFIHFTATTAANIFCSGSTSGKTNASATTKQARSALRQVYAFAFASTAIPHVATWTISLASTLVPMIFDIDIVPALHPSRVFLNTLPWSGARVSSLGQGVLWFLQWDQLLGTAGTLLWAVSLYASAHQARKVRVGCVGFVPKVAALCAVSGVAGAAVELMWERDELVLQAGEGEEKKRK
ncbi:hypothetical protein FQN53_002544 [Emmonsiellopsis sp. PD_33]|nr:hypothetical protein FQN53_002544 [Emmonsiellopsis sp. PD_33]